MIIGVMGMSGSGKSTFSAYLEGQGAYIIDADKIAREVVEKGTKGLKEIEKSFGSDVLLSDGSLDRKKLGEIVFNDKKKLEILNSITTPEINREIIKRATENNDKLVVIDCPMLHKISAIEICDKVVFVTASEEILIKRIMERDNISFDNAKARIKSQNSEFLRFADVIIENNKDILSLYNEADKLIKHTGVEPHVLARKDDSNDK